MALLDQLGGPPRRRVQFATHGVKHSEPERHIVRLRGTEFFDQQGGALLISRTNYKRCEPADGFAVRGHQRIRSLRQRQRLLESSLVRMDGSERPDCSGEVLISLERASQLSFRVVIPSN